MEQTTFQQRIEEKAKQRLLKDLKTATDKQNEIIAIVGEENYPKTLNFREYYNDYGRPKTTIIFDNDDQKIYDSLLPKYVEMVTDEILQKVDEIDWLLHEKNVEQEY